MYFKKYMYVAITCSLKFLFVQTPHIFFSFRVRMYFSLRSRLYVLAWRLGSHCCKLGLSFVCREWIKL